MVGSVVAKNEAEFTTPVFDCAFNLSGHNLKPPAKYLHCALLAGKWFGP
jgi:hypothetical protein